MTLASSSWRTVGGIMSGGVLVVIVVVLRGPAVDNLRWNSAGRQWRREVEKAAQKKGQGVGIVVGDGVRDTTTPCCATVFVQGWL